MAHGRGGKRARARAQAQAQALVLDAGYRPPADDLLRCPQLIDAALDVLAYSLLSRHVVGHGVHAGARRIRALLAEGSRPAIVIVCTSVGAAAARDVTALRLEAVSAGVPVVHALNHLFMARACGFVPDESKKISAVAVMPTADATTVALVHEMIARAVQAYAGFAELLAAARQAAMAPVTPSNSPVRAAVATPEAPHPSTTPHPSSALLHPPSAPPSLPSAPSRPSLPHPPLLHPAPRRRFDLAALPL